MFLSLDLCSIFLIAHFSVLDINTNDRLSLCVHYGHMNVVLGITSSIFNH